MKHFLSVLLTHLVCSNDKSNILPTDIPKRIEQLRQWARMHQEISSAELKLERANHAIQKRRSPADGMTYYGFNNKYTKQSNEKMCMKPCARQDLYVPVKHFEVAFDGWRPLLSDNEMINIGDCVGNCQASKFLDYRSVFEGLSKEKIRGCATSSTSSIEVIKNNYVASLSGVVIDSCFCNAIHYCT